MNEFLALSIAQYFSLFASLRGFLIPSPYRTAQIQNYLPTNSESLRYDICVCLKLEATCTDYYCYVQFVLSLRFNFRKDWGRV